MRRSSPWMNRGPSASQRKTHSHLVSSSPILLPGIHFLQSLDLSGIKISDEDMEQTLTAWSGSADLTALKSLDVSGNKMSDVAERLCQGLTGLTSLQSLDVSGNKISNVTVLDKVYENIVVYSHVTGHQRGVSSVHFSPDGTRLVTGSYDKTVKIWNPATGEELCQLSCDSAVLSVDWHDNCIAAGDVDGKIYVFDAAAGKIKSSLRGHRYAPSLSKECFLSLG